MTNVEVSKYLEISFNKDMDRGMRVVNRICEECGKKAPKESDPTCCETCKSFFCNMSCFTSHKRKYNLQDKKDPSIEFGEPMFKNLEEKSDEHKTFKISGFSAQMYRFYYNSLTRYVMSIRKTKKPVMKLVLERFCTKSLELFKANFLALFPKFGELDDKFVTEYNITRNVLTNFFFAVWKNWKHIVKIGKKVEMTDDEKKQKNKESLTMAESLIAEEEKERQKKKSTKGAKVTKKKKKRKKKKMMKKKRKDDDDLVIHYAFEKMKIGNANIKSDDESAEDNTTSPVKEAISPIDVVREKNVKDSVPVADASAEKSEVVKDDDDAKKETPVETNDNVDDEDVVSENNVMSVENVVLIRKEIMSHLKSSLDTITTSHKETQLVLEEKVFVMKLKMDEMEKTNESKMEEMRNENVRLKETIEKMEAEMAEKGKIENDDVAVEKEKVKKLEDKTKELEAELAKIMKRIDDYNTRKTDALNKYGNQKKSVKGIKEVGKLIETRLSDISRTIKQEQRTIIDIHSIKL